MRIVAVVSPLFLVACATTYEGPTAVAQSASTSSTASQSVLMASAKRALVLEGFQITASDDQAGVISTAPRPLRLSPQQADCGTTMGIDYLKDNRTSTRVAFGVIAEEGRVTVRTTIEGEYKPGSVSQDITLSCVSRGTLEHELLYKIIAGISAK